jgi:hypothetical protein
VPGGDLEKPRRQLALRAPVRNGHAHGSIAGNTDDVPAGTRVASEDEIRFEGERGWHHPEKQMQPRKYEDWKNNLW